MNTRKVRLAEPADLPRLEALKSAASYQASSFLGEEESYRVALERLREYLPHQEELPDWRLLVLEENGDLGGYLLFCVDDEHGVTHQLQALVLDHAIFSFEALDALTTRARRIVSAFENEYLLAELPHSDRRRQLWFYRCGFRAEQTRVVKRIPKGYQGASSSQFRIRPARDEDLPFVLEVHATNAHAYLPAGREVDSEAVELRYQLTYLALDLQSQTGSLYFILEETDSGIPAGYLFLQEGPLFATTPSYYVYDAAIAPGFAGRGLSRYLQGAAETLAGQKGALVYGDGSLGTPSIDSWHTQMGYAVDTIRFALDCRARDESPVVKGM